MDAAYNETAMTTEFNANEWGIDGGLDMNFFAARFYDPVLARWHSPDPLEQFHSPYLAMCDDPANFTDPDGRAGIPFLQDFMKSTVGECVIGSIGAIGGAFGIAGLMSIGGAIGNVVSSGLSLVAAGNSVKSMAQIAGDGSAAASGGNSQASQIVMGSTGVTVSAFYGAGATSNLAGSDLTASMDGGPGPTRGRSNGPGRHFFNAMNRSVSYYQTDPGRSTSIHAPFWGFNMGNLFTPYVEAYVLTGGFDMFLFSTRSELFMAATTIDWKRLDEDHRLICDTCTESNNYAHILEEENRKKEQWQNVGNFAGTLSGAFSPLVIGAQFQRLSFRGPGANGGGIKFPGNNPSKAPAGFQWRGKPGSKPGSTDGNWYNPKTKESLRPDLNHGAPYGPHWDYRDSDGKWWRIFPDETFAPK